LSLLAERLKKKALSALLKRTKDVQLEISKEIDAKSVIETLSFSSCNEAARHIRDKNLIIKSLTNDVTDNSPIKIVAEASTYSFMRIDFNSQHIDMALDALKKDDVCDEFLPKKAWKERTICDILRDEHEIKGFIGYAYVQSDEIISFANYRNNADNTVDISIIFTAKEVAYRSKGLASSLVRLIVLENKDCNISTTTYEANTAMRKSLVNCDFYEGEFRNDRIDDTYTVFYHRKPLEIEYNGKWKIGLFREELRPNELNELSELLRNDGVIFVHGDGGNGKTELVKHYCNKRLLDEHLRFNDFYFIEFKGSLRDTFDYLICVIPELKADFSDWRAVLDFFKEQNCLLIIDNYNTLADGSSEADLATKDVLHHRVITHGADIIFTTRCTINEEFKNVYVDYLELNELSWLFKKLVKGRRSFADDDINKIIIDFSLNIIDRKGKERKVCLTLIIVLIAKYLAGNNEGADTLLQKVRKITQIEQPIDIYRNDKPLHKAFIDILVLVFDFANFKDFSHAKDILTCVCVLPDSQILSVNLIYKLMGLTENIDKEQANETIKKLCDMSIMKKFNRDGRTPTILMHNVISDAIAKQLKLKASECETILSNFLATFEHNEANKWSNAKEFSSAIHRFENDNHPLVLEFLGELAFLLSWNDQSEKCGELLSKFWIEYNKLPSDKQDEIAYIKAYFKFCDAIQDDFFTNEWFSWCVYFNEKCLELIEKHPELIKSDYDKIIKRAVFMVNIADAQEYLADYIGHYPKYFCATDNRPKPTEKQVEKYKEAINSATQALLFLGIEIDLVANKIIESEEILNLFQKCKINGKIDNNCEYCVVKARALKAMSYAYNGIGETKRAECFAHEALRCCITKDKRHGIKPTDKNPDTLRIYDLLGLIYMNTQHELARGEFKSGYDYYQETSKPVAISKFRYLHSLALSCYYDNKSDDALEEAEHHGKQAVSHSINTKAAPPRRAVCHYNLAMTYYKCYLQKQSLKDFQNENEILEAARFNFNETIKILDYRMIWRDDIINEYEVDNPYLFNFDGLKNLCQIKIDEIEEKLIEMEMPPCLIFSS
jgi:hypothetical protein